MFTVMVIRLILPGSLIWIILFSSTLSHAGLAKTIHNLYPKDPEKNCALCHKPHSNQTQPALWMTEKKPRAGSRIHYFTMPPEEEAICLSCHDGVLAKDICVNIDPKIEEKPELNLEELNNYYKKDLIGFGTCEKHYNMVSLFPSELPGKQCTTCHNIHLEQNSRKAGLINSDLYTRHKICLICHLNQ